MSTDSFPASWPQATPDDDQSEPLFVGNTGEDPENDSDPSHEALYAVLNLPKDCSDDDIAKAYKRLAGRYFESNLSVSAVWLTAVYPCLDYSFTPSGSAQGSRSEERCRSPFSGNQQSFRNIGRP